jgi:hypothetical protein
MAGRGSGIGMGNIGGIGAGGPGPSRTSTRSAAPGQLYGPKVKSGAGMSTHHWLWVLVALELGILVVLRKVVFKSYHGG